MSSKASGKEKKSSLGKKLFRRGSVRSVGSFMSRVLKTLSTLSHFGSEVQPPEGEKDDGGFAAFKNEGKGSVASDDSDCCGFLSRDKVPGVSGLKNHGNTCFMNAILQCLSNTELFAEYLALEQFRGQAEEEDKPKANGVHPTRKEKGEVTEQLAGLVRALWTFEYTPQQSREFKNTVAKRAMQYRGNAQHDAQEFLLWLLDRVHEDLNNMGHNRPSLKPPVEEDDGVLEGPSPPLSAGSFVQELFQAQYRSSLTCPHCQKQSNTFDPFLCISLPIPLPHTRPLYVTVVYQGKYSHCMRIGVAVPLNSTVSRLREAVSRETKIPPDQFVLTEMYYDGFHRSFCDDDDDLDIIQESDSIFAFETPETFKLESLRSKRGSLLANLNQNNLKYGTEGSRTPSFLQGAVNPASPNKNTADKMILLICNRACIGHQGRRFGLPFVLYMERTVTWDVLQKAILEKMHHLLRQGVYIQVGPFSLRVVGVVGITYLLPQEEFPLCHPTVERLGFDLNTDFSCSVKLAYKSCGTGGPPHVKIVVEWDKETKDYLFGHTEEEYIPDAESVYLHREQHHHPQACTLAQCFQLYTKEEQLAPDDAWRCPHCKQLQQGRIKLSLWTLPDVLILHLKRFRQEGDRRVKMQNIVRFPLVGMDMAPHMVKRSQSSWSLPSHWSPWRRPYGLGRNPDDYLYDLYAVCNHHGNMHGGHYTAYCKNSIDGQWYCFDDSEVQPMPDEEVCHQTAYILFYQRRATIPSWSANSSVAALVNRLPGSKPPSLASGASSRRTSLASLAESMEFPGDRSEDDGGFSTRPFVRSIQRQSLSSRSSIASPLTLSENGMKPSWSLSAKLQMRSNSPSRFSLDSRSSPPLERIGEACDDKVSTSCFGSYSRHERQTGSKAPLAMMEGNSSDDGSGKRNTIEVYSRAHSLAEKKSSKGEPLDNNNLITAVDQNVHGTSTKELKHKISGGSVSKADVSGAKKTSTKAKGDQEKPSKKRQSTSSAQKSPSSQVSSSPQGKGAKVTNLKEKSDPAKARSVSSGTPTKKKETSQSQEAAPTSAASKTKQRLTPTPQSSASPSPTAKKSFSVAERSSSLSSSRKKLAERTSSRDLSHASPLTDKPRAPLKGAEGGQPDRKPVRSSSSSSSLTSLRSPSISSRDLRRASKSEDKGLSFFKNALRQKETRRSADLGKSAILSKKASERTARSSSQTKLSMENGEGEGNSSPASLSSKAASEDKESPKSSTPLKRSLLPAGKCKSSSSDAILQSPVNGKRPLEKTTSSRKLSCSMQSGQQRRLNNV
ncbi:Ubiquitin carboxyl-terminal hydrolase 31 [Bagarius yarrelli]|uniref:ubiquitinyl hydrolase 1 n=1 Tax=Bagarius yarrelli TaxID=175774 RepID=A0A556V2A8_BAGYA|nr:Ubiquitin carboxyl-terminal hydrolase 31 [Bagarius yarrelli]